VRIEADRRFIYVHGALQCKPINGPRRGVCDRTFRAECTTAVGGTTPAAVGSTSVLMGRYANGVSPAVEALVSTMRWTNAPGGRGNC
jgi:hypothetical protein